ncbi:MAG: hypothetical protein DMG73_14865 [Acidobacteria bacterium]|nr:MAG: hypothetical protein DMG73_14865 [Acidobacteriota bacterium]
MKDPRFPGQIVAVLDTGGRVLARRPVSSALALRLPAFPLRASRVPQFYELAESSTDADDSCRGIYQLAAGTSGLSSIVVVTDPNGPKRNIARP